MPLSNPPVEKNAQGYITDHVVLRRDTYANLTAASMGVGEIAMPTDGVGLIENNGSGNFSFGSGSLNSNALGSGQQEFTDGGLIQWGSGAQNANYFANGYYGGHTSVSIACSGGEIDVGALGTGQGPYIVYMNGETSNITFSTDGMQDFNLFTTPQTFYKPSGGNPTGIGPLTKLLLACWSVDEGSVLIMDVTGAPYTYPISVANLSTTTTTVGDGYGMLEVKVTGTATALTVNLPAHPGDGDEFVTVVNGTITTVTFSGNGNAISHTFAAAMSVAGTSSVRYRFSKPSAKWYKA